MPTLVVFKLSVQSSYSDNVEEAADESDYDTLQWWLTDTEAWRIKTYAMDNDIHTHLIGGPCTTSFAIENTEKNYGDVIADRFVIEISDQTNRLELDEKLRLLGGAEALEIAPTQRFAFWNYDGRTYRTKSTPR